VLGVLFTSENLELPHAAAVRECAPVLKAAAAFNRIRAVRARAKSGVGDLECRPSTPASL